MTIRVVLTGPESTGKTTLARELAAHFRAGYGPEFARDYAEHKRAPLTAADVQPIARGQRAAEDMAMLSSGGDLVILDTDLISTVVYARHYYGACPEWVERAARERRGSLYLLHHPDVPWVADADVREPADARSQLFRKFKSALEEVEATVVEIEGPWPERRRRAVAAIDALLPESFTRPHDSPSD